MSENKIKIDTRLFSDYTRISNDKKDTILQNRNTDVFILQNDNLKKTNSNSFIGINTRTYKSLNKLL